jgi:hypothetical protein
VTDLYEEIVVCGRLPVRPDGKVDLYKVDRFLRKLDNPAVRVMVLKRLLKAK